MVNIQHEERAEALDNLSRRTAQLEAIDRRRTAAQANRDDAVREVRAMGVPAVQVAARARISTEMVRRIWKGRK